MSANNSIPSYRKHRQSGQAVVTLPDGYGRRRDVLLGKYGTAESRREYARIINEWEATGRRLPRSGVNGDLTLNELIHAYWKFVEGYYRRPDGTATSEVGEYRRSLRPVRVTHGRMVARDFGPLALKAVRQMMVEGWNDAEHGPQSPLARGVINQRIGRIRRMFRWAAENEMVAPSVYHGLLAVRGLSRGRSPARETDPIQPVSEALVQATLPFLRPQVASMVKLQLLTGMRPGEVVIMRGIDLDMSGKIWLYRPGSDKGPQGIHKTAWRGHQRVIAIGPRGQEVLRPWLRLKLKEYLFQPLEAEKARDAERRKSRKTKITPSQARRQLKRRPQKSPGDHYTAASYGRAIRQACFLAGTRVFVTCSVEGLVVKVEGFSEIVVRRRGVGVHEGRLIKIAGLELVMVDRITGCEKCFQVARNTKILLNGQPSRLEEFQTTLPPWHPHQLRHTKATEIRREVGLDAARAVLGHRSPAVTEVYAELDQAKAAEVMERLG